MIELKLRIEKDLTKNDRFVVIDDTAWGTVPEGSEATPVNRNERRLFLLIDRFTENEFVAVKPEKITNNGNPSTVSQWEIRDIPDGYYRMFLVAALPFSPSLPYSVNKVVASGEKLYVGLDANIPAGTEVTDTYYWAEITDTESFPILSNSGAEAHVKDHIHDMKSRLCIAEKALKYASNSCECPDEQLSKNYLKGLLFHHASVYAAAFGEFKDSGRFIDRVIERCDGKELEEKDCGC